MGDASRVNKNKQCCTIKASIFAERIQHLRYCRGANTPFEKLTSRRWALLHGDPVGLINATRFYLAVHRPIHRHPRFHSRAHTLA